MTMTSPSYSNRLEYEDYVELHRHIKEIADGYLEVEYEDMVWDSLNETVKILQHVIERMELGD